MNIAWIITVIALLCLGIATWQKRSVLSAIFAVIASVALSIAITNNNLSAMLIVLDILLIVGTWYLAHSGRMKSWVGIVWIGVLVLALVIAKVPQSPVSPAIWIGVSYLIFRLIHVCFEARRDRLTGETLPESLSYVLHPATLIAGPIDRIQHHVGEQRNAAVETTSKINDGLWRLFIGLFKKTVLAGILAAFIAQHDLPARPDQPIGIAWLWLLAFTFWLYFDFAAYSDMAIGISRLMGIRLPENFANPYMQPTIGRFWQTWHITLSHWLRDYIFFPMSRALLKKYGNAYQTPIMFASHMTTMVLCGLWHGLGSGFVVWGAWHGLGLFGQSQMPMLRQRFKIPVLPIALSTVLTFIFVMLGWVFFSTDLPTALRIFARLFGIN